jgi:prolycopene isomerase
MIDVNFKPCGSCGIFERGKVTFGQGSSILYGFGEKGFSPHRFAFNCLEVQQIQFWKNMI